MYLEERFTKRPALNAVLASSTSNNTAAIIANRDWEAIGTNATTALCTYSAGGGITLTTAGAILDSEIVTPHLDTNQSAWAGTKWGTQRSPSFGCILCTDATISGAGLTRTIYAGLKLANGDTTATDANQAYWMFKTGVAGGNWQLITSNAGTDTVTDSGVTAAVSTQYKLEIKINANQVVTGYINGRPVGSTATTVANNIDLIPYIGIKLNSTLAVAFHVRRAWISMDYALTE